MDRPAAPALTPLTPRLPLPVRDETAVVQSLLDEIAPALDWQRVIARAAPWITEVRRHPAPFWAMESLLKEYPISEPEGLALMRLAEALLRVPDAETAVALTADQLGRATFDLKGGEHAWIAALSANAIALSKKLLPADGGEPGLFKRLGAQTVVSATVRAIQLLGRQFVLGQTIADAQREAAAARKAQPNLRFSYDMLGEGARTEADAERYLESYCAAIQSVAGGVRAASPEAADGVSIKLSALHARYEEAQSAQVFEVLLPRLLRLIDLGAQAGINLTIDAEESERLELSLDVFEALLAHIARAHPHWGGFGLAVQAYQTRAAQVIDAVAALARKHGVRLMVRLVKGAYWDAEIKRAQELGLDGYPVFTHKHHTDLSYLACARRLFAAAPHIYPQFASHNAGTIAAVLELAHAAGTPFEMQRLHGMGEGVYREVLADPAIACRVYAPVGAHRDLLAYLVRRLLENGANSSFVHQLADASVAVVDLLASPLQLSNAATLPAPPQLYGAARVNSRGVDLACRTARAPYLAAIAATPVPAVPLADAAAVTQAMQRAQAAQTAWNALGVTERAACLNRAADALEARSAEFCAVLVKEAHKTLGDALAEVREAIDFCRYYAAQAPQVLADRALPGPTGESNTLRLHGRGVFVCISPWNFPLAIFTGQVVAALVAGNAVVAKPAEQTPAVAQLMVDLLHAAGVPAEALLCLHGPGETVGAALVADARCAGVAFTGSTAVARLIARNLLDDAQGARPIVPLIAETGGINAMIVDSTALHEQVIDAVVTSAFRSAGQRCSALRVLCVQDDVADPLLAMLAGAMAQLRVGDPARFDTDVGPVIDVEAHANLERHLARLYREAKLIARTPMDEQLAGHYIAPIAFEVARVSDVTEEVFGPVLQVVRWKASELDALIDEINGLGYGLTLGVQTRIDTRAERIAARARVGNVYVNRNMIGAVVGVQPFGGEGLSGTGPKAGGPHYLLRFAAEQTLTINTAAAGGNATLLAHWPAQS